MLGEMYEKLTKAEMSVASDIVTVMMQSDLDTIGCSKALGAAFKWACENKLYHKTRDER